MSGVIRGAGSAGLLAAGLAAVLAAGCSAGAPAPYRATADTCYAFGVQALQRHITVTTVPRACSGLSRAQVNLAVARAIHEVVGPQRKVVARLRAYQESTYLRHLIRTVPPPEPPPGAAPPPGAVSLAAGAGRPPAALSLRLAGLAAWIITAVAGSYLLADWLADRRTRRRAGAAGMPSVTIVGHFTLAVAGLGVWIAFVATAVPFLAWIAVGMIVVTAGLGLATLVAALPEPAVSAWPAGADPATATRMALAEAPASRPMPVIVVAVHGVLATAAILLAVLAAIKAG